MKKLVGESLDNILTPKSQKEIQDALKNIDQEEYYDMVENEIDKIDTEDDIDIDNYKEMVRNGYKNQIVPSLLGIDIITYHYKNNWQPNGASGDMELKVNGSGDGVEYRYIGDIIPKTAEIEYEETEEDEDAYDARAFFADEHDNRHYLDQAMRINESVFQPKSKEEITRDIEKLSLVKKYDVWLSNPNLLPKAITPLIIKFLTRLRDPKTGKQLIPGAIRGMYEQDPYTLSFNFDITKSTKRGRDASHFIKIEQEEGDKKLYVGIYNHKNNRIDQEWISSFKELMQIYDKYK